MFLDMLALLLVVGLVLGGFAIVYARMHMRG